MDLAIIGGGLSGTLLAAQIAAGPDVFRHIYLVEPHHLARGIAYSTPYTHHLLNVAVARMSAADAAPHDLAQWLTERGSLPKDDMEANHWHHAPSQNFIPRKLYGDYLQDKLDAAQKILKDRLILVRDEAVAIAMRDDGACVTLVSKKQLSVARIALCVGHFAPLAPQFEGASVLDASCYVHNPWQWSSLDRVGQGSRVALLGAGLTMVDVAMTLAHEKKVEHMAAVSRHGLMPLSHVEGLAPIASVLGTKHPQRATSLVRAVRQAIAVHVSNGGNWRQALDSLRGQSVQLWRSLSEGEQARILRHAKTVWDVHRHRVAPAVGRAIGEMRHRGQLSIGAGRLLSVKKTSRGKLELTFRRRHDHSLWREEVDWLVNCTGGHNHWQKATAQLPSTLLQSGLVVSGPHGIGLAVDEHGAVLGADKVPSTRIWAMGSARLGADFESIAVPELRAQAKRLAVRLSAEAGL